MAPDAAGQVRFGKSREELVKMHDRRHTSWIAGAALLVSMVCIQAACSENPPPEFPELLADPVQIDDPPEIVQSVPPPAPAPAPLPPPAPETRVLTPDDIASRSLEELNRATLLAPIFYLLDSAELDPLGRQVVEANAELLARFPTWNVTIEGHCDERGTPEYNLGLGERRALAAQQYLLQLGLDAARVRTVSYGKEFPFDPGHDEIAWASNRRAHFVITEK
jgi:peptidoglycan-associated lipoprotein